MDCHNSSSMADGRVVSIREVAQHAGVTTSSVSRVLREHPDVSQAMRGRVLDAVAELGYEPNLLAQSLRRGASLSVGFVLRDISSPSLSRMVLGAETVMNAHGYSLLLTNSEALAEREPERLRLLARRRVDGLMLSLADETYEPTLEELRRLRVPFVLVDRELRDGLAHSAVRCDEEAAMREVAEHLLGLGHRRVGLVCGPLTVRPAREEARVLARVCERAGAEASVEPGPFGEEHGAEAVARMLDASGPPTAFVLGTSVFLPGALRVLRERGLRVPEDVSLVTFDDVPFLDFLDPPVTSVSRRPVDLGRRAAELLLRLLAGGGPEQVSVPMTFVPRASTSPPPEERRSPSPEALDRTDRSSGGASEA
jgi:LacI family transcriptional regulator